MSGLISFSKTGAHLALSANEEVRTGASGSIGEGARLESADSFERTFEGPGCGGRTSPPSLSSTLDSPRFRWCTSVPLPSCLRCRTTGVVLVALRFSRWHELFIIIHDRGKEGKPFTVLGASWR